MTRKNPNAFSVTCPAHKILARMMSKWTGLIIRCLSMHTMRYSDLRRAIGGISQKMLTQTLRELEADGLIERKVYPVVPPKVEYSLTGLGRTLVKPLVALGNWAETHQEEIEEANVRYERKIQKSA